jgi:hypothetical protein
MLPFTRDQFMAVFAGYNQAVWPVQVLAYLLGLAIVVLLLRPSSRGSRFIAAGLGLMWAWTGIVYHGMFFSTINTAALGFGLLFVLQSLVLFRLAATGSMLPPGVQAGWTGWLGGAFVLYAAVAYPLLGMWFGHRYPEMPMFGITPCPLTLFTFGVFLLTTRRVPLWALAIPVIWSVIGGSAAFLLAVPQDWPLWLGPAVALVLVLRNRRRDTGMIVASN